MIGSLIGGKLSDKFGRRKALLIDDVIFIVGTIVCTFAPRYSILVLGRLIVGFGVGIASAIIPLFITEISPVRIRGQIGGFCFLFFCLFFYFFIFFLLFFIFFV
jgi:predicted MFS family arabinose efflux permease